VRKRRLIPSLCTAALVIIGAVTAGFIATRVNKAHAAFDPAAYGAAPYVMPLDNNPPDLPTVMSQSGVKAFTLAFILANNGSCTPAWDGTANVSSDTQVAGIINSIRNAGGDVVVSAGGYGGHKLGEYCGSPDATAAAYQQVINKYSLKAMDFDLEEPEYENTAAINNEVGAAKILQANNPGIVIQITTAGTTAGTGYFGQNVLNTAKSIGFTPTNFTIMPFDGGFSGASSQISALQSFNTMLMNTFGWDSATAYNHEGFSGMNGRTDSAEYFYISDFNTVLNFAQSNHMSKFTFWSVNRDRQCSPPDNNGLLSGTCSSVAQNDWDFSRVIAQFSGVSPTTTPPIGSGWTQCASENQNCSFSGSAAVAYGANGQFAYGTFTNGVSCSNGVFGDPDYGVGKSCFVSTSFVPPAPGVWTQCANENGTCSFSGTMQVAYGNSGHYTYGTYTNGVSCSNSVFPDPDYGVVKACFTAPSGTNVSTPTPTPPPANTPTIAPTSPPSNGLVINGGFEAGNLNGWTCDAGTTVITSPVHSGSYALQLNPNSSLSGQCTQTINVQANRSYTLTAYVYGNYAYLGVNGGASTWTSSTGYTQLSVPFTTGSGQTSITIYVHGWYSQGSVDVDDINLQ
jgi:chitinase